MSYTIRRAVESKKSNELKISISFLKIISEVPSWYITLFCYFLMEKDFFNYSTVLCKTTV